MEKTLPMDEKVLMQSKNLFVKKVYVVLCIVMLFIAAFVTFEATDVFHADWYFRSAADCKSEMNLYKELYESGGGTAYHTYYGADYRGNYNYGKYFSEYEAYEKMKYWDSYGADWFSMGLADVGKNVLLSATFVALVVLFLHFWLRKTELIITNKRVFGRGIFGKRVDLPIDSISSIAKSWPKGICIATSSGKILFLAIENQSEMYNCIGDLLIKRQKKNESVFITSMQEILPNSVDDIKKYKDLLDGGVITQEEFDAKKRQLLGL